MQFLFGASARATLTGMVSVAALGTPVPPASLGAISAGSDQPVAPALDSASPVQQAQTLMGEGKLIAAQARLSTAIRSTTLDEADRDDAIELLQAR